MRFLFAGPLLKQASGLFALAGQPGQRIGKLISSIGFRKKNGSELPQGQL
jgi:hypothetical protein